MEHGVENDVNGMKKVGHEERRTIYLAMERRKHNFFGGGQGRGTGKSWLNLK